MAYVIEKININILNDNKLFVYKIYSHLDKAVQLTEYKDKAMMFNTIEYAEQFIDFMKLKNFCIKTR